MTPKTRMTMTIAQALKHKNRVVARISSLSKDAQDHNSILVESEAEINVGNVVAARKSLQDHLIALKTKISSECSQVRRDIFEMGELKSEIAFYRRMSTKHGNVAGAAYFGGGSQDSQTFKAAIRKEEVDRVVLALERKIDGIQDKLDAFNAEHKIEIEVPDVCFSPVK